MLAERILTAVVRNANARSLKLEGCEEGICLPPADESKQYLLYVHVPFCSRLCPYCSFNRFPFLPELAVPYFESLRREMRMVAERGFQCTSMYVGGGTPTVMIDELCQTIDLARDLFDIQEVSSETNPDHLMPEIVDPLVDRVDRFSVGVQSFNDGLLKRMDRYGKYGSGSQIMERLKWVEGRFHSLNVDMIFNFPSQTREMLVEDVRMLKESGTNQCTFYPLMASPVVRQSLKESVGRVSYRREAEFYRLIVDELSDTFEPASAWTFSRLGGGMIDEYIVDYEEYVGIGSGAFSFLEGELFVNTFSLKEYGDRIASRRFGVVGRRAFSRKERMRYRYMMGLFGLGFDKKAFERDFGVSVERGLPLESAFMRGAGAYASDTPEAITLTDKGRYLLVAMMREFFVGVNGVRDQARAGLPEDERDLLFGEGASECDEHGSASAAVSETEDAEHAPVP
jgi:coproporphyrinogen III oxidase-like Fe-S oxidoreductase